MTERDFWRWFQANLDRLSTVEGDLDPIMNETLDALNRYCEGLGFEVSNKDNYCNEFIISSNGDKELFDAVRRLVSKSPIIENWTIRAFKPPMGFDFVTEYEGFQFDPKEITFAPMKHKTDPSVIGLRAFVPGYHGENKRHFLAAVNKIIDTGLGEEVSANRIRFVDILPVPKNQDMGDFYRLSDLKEYLNALDRKLYHG